MKQNPGLTLYLPIGLISSEKLLVLSSFLVPGQLNIKFEHDCRFFADYDPDTNLQEHDTNISGFSFDSSDNKKSLESSFNSSMNSSFDMSLSHRKEREGVKKSQFDKNFRLTKILEKTKFKKSIKKRESLRDNREFETIRKYKPVLRTARGRYIVDFINIIIEIVQHCEFKYDTLKIEVKEYNKFKNYMIFIEKQIDYHVNNLLYELYDMSENNKEEQFHVMDRNLKQLIKRLDCFETFILVKYDFVFGNNISLIDLMLFGSLSKMFIFFFDGIIREGCLYNTTRWFKNFLDMPEIHETYGVINLCIRNYLSNFENLTKNSIKNLKIIENKFNQEFQLNGFKQCMNRFIKLRADIKHESCPEDQFELPFEQILKPLKNSKKKINNGFNNSGIYKTCDRIDDIDLLIMKTEETQLNNYKSENYSVWVFDYIRENEEPDYEDDEGNSPNQQVHDFYDELTKTISSNSNKFICYITIFSNCEEPEGEQNYSNEFEECTKHENKIFMKKNLRGLVIQKGHDSLNFLSNYESLDQIILAEKRGDTAIETLKDFINQKNLFEMEKIYQEIII